MVEMIVCCFGVGSGGRVVFLGMVTVDDVEESVSCEACGWLGGGMCVQSVG